MSYLKRLLSALRNSLELDLVTRAYCFEQISNSKMMKMSHPGPYSSILSAIMLCAAGNMHARVLKYFIAFIEEENLYRYTSDIRYLGILAAENGDLKLLQYLIEKNQKAIQDYRYNLKTVSYGVIHVVELYGLPHLVRWLAETGITVERHRCSQSDMEIIESHKQAAIADKK